MFSCPLRRGVSANDEFLFVDTLEFDPCAASPAGFVNGVAQFADDSFQAAALHFLEELVGISPNRARVSNLRITYAGTEFLQNVLPRL